MENKFAEALKAKNAMDSESVTENGAVGYARTKSRLVDFFFKAGSMRNMSENDIAVAFSEAYAENPRRALELLFFLRDCRGGMGEKRTFNVCFDWLIKNYPGDACDLTKLIPEYGSWKSFFDLTDSFRKNKKVESVAQKFFNGQWGSDVLNCVPENSISLMGKWCPSENSSSRATKRLAAYWRKVVGLDAKTYRKSLSMFREKIRVVERDMSGRNWSGIDYNFVPAKAGILYRNAFLKHDAERRKKWLDDLANGKEGVKINTSGLTVADMVHNYIQTIYANRYGRIKVEEDATIEAAWRDLVEKNRMKDGDISLLPVIDGSGSMYASISQSSEVLAIDVSIGLGLFLANINAPKWRGYAIEFGGHPVVFKVPTGASLLSQVKVAMEHNDCANTDLAKVFDLVLNTSVSNGFSQKDIPEIIIFTDGEFDNGYVLSPNPSAKLFDKISDEWEQHGYVLPRLTFWNINSRTNTIPLLENELGVSLLSGYSQSIMDMVLSRKFDPLSVLLERLDSPRYDLVREALKD